jgi:hypothetical protein
MVRDPNRAPARGFPPQRRQIPRTRHRRRQAPFLPQQHPPRSLLPDSLAAPRCPRPTPRPPPRRFRRRVPAPHSPRPALRRATRPCLLAHPPASGPRNRYDERRNRPPAQHPPLGHSRRADLPRVPPPHRRNRIAPAHRSSRSPLRAHPRTRLRLFRKKYFSRNEPGNPNKTNIGTRDFSRVLFPYTRLPAAFSCGIRDFSRVLCFQLWGRRNRRRFRLPSG